MAECLEQLQAVSEGRVDPLSVAHAWQGDDVAFRLGGWRYLVQWLIRARLVPADDVANRLVQKLQTIAESVDCQSLYRFQDRIDRAINTLGSGLNRQLVLEDLLISWAAMPTRRQNNGMQSNR